MAMQDLYQALNMFSDGVKQLSMSTAINQANDQVQQIKASQMNDMQQRSALQGLSNQLVAHLAAGGTPATTIQAVAGAIGPKQYADADAMNKDALLTGNKWLGKQASEQQEFENNNDAKLEEIREKYAAKSAANDPIRAVQAKMMADSRFQKASQSIADKINTQDTRFGNISKLQGVNNAIKDARALTDNPNLNPQQLPELAKIMDRVFTQGSATVSGAKEMGYSSLDTELSAARQWLSNHMQNTDVTGYVNYVRKTLDRVEGINNNIITEAKRDAVRGATGLAKMSPDSFETWAHQQLGEGATVDRKTGKVTLDSDLVKQDNIKSALETVLANPQDPRAKAFIQRATGPDKLQLDEVLRQNPKMRSQFLKMKSQLWSGGTD